MTELERYEPARDVVVRVNRSLTERAGDLAAAYEFGKALAETSFAPAAFRGKPYEAAAAILSGDEVGLSPMQALRSYFVISGTPAMYARAMVALVLSHGHEVWTAEDTPAKVTVCGRRRGSERVETVTWTTERARIAGYTGNKKYQTDPQAMLYARAASDVARRIAPDVLLGLGYSAEEVELAEIETATVSRAGTTKGKVARKSIGPAPVEEPELEPPARMAPGRKTDGGGLRPVQDVTLPEPDLPVPPLPIPIPDPNLEPGLPVRRDPAEIDPGGVTPTGERPGMITRAQSRMVFAMLRTQGVTERQDCLDYVNGILGTEIESSAEITKGQAMQLLDRLTELETAGGDDPDDDGESHQPLPYKDD